jgi:cytochrome oxidase assembly protein ShyY1
MRALTIAGIVVFALAVSFTAVQLGRWQWHRHDVRAAEMVAFAEGQEAAPAPLSEVVSRAATSFPDDARWRTATVSGAFDPTSLTWLRNRPVDGNPASHALAWFVTDDGRALLVDAGWIQAEAAVKPTLPTTRLALTVTMRPTEADDGRTGGGATRITPDQMPPPPSPMVQGYGVLSAACQDPCGPLPGLAVTPLPALSLGPHLSYAAQWYLLALAAPIIAIVWIRREVRGEQDPSAVTAAPRRRRTEPSDEDIEDAL